MNRAFQSWTPRAFPLLYDSLALSLGCQTITGGTKQYGTLPFQEICFAPHNPADPIFGKPDTISYCNGPSAFGVAAKPWPYRWTAWVSTAGIRIAQLPVIVPPAVGTGSPSTLYPSTTPTKISLGFSNPGYPALAIQLNSSTIEIKWTEDGTTVNKLDFTGTSPCLFNNGIIYDGGFEVKTDLVLFYLRGVNSRKIYARFERDSFAIEYPININLPTILKNLYQSDAIYQYDVTTIEPGPGTGGISTSLQSADGTKQSFTLYCTAARSAFTTSILFYSDPFRANLIFAEIGGFQNLPTVLQCSGSYLGTDFAVTITDTITQIGIPTHFTLNVSFAEAEEGTGNQQLLFATDASGRDITLHSEAYSVFSSAMATFAPSIKLLNYQPSAVSPPEEQEAGKISYSIAEIVYFDTVSNTTATDTDLANAGKLSLGIAEIVYSS